MEEEPHLGCEQELTRPLQTTGRHRSGQGERRHPALSRRSCDAGGEADADGVALVQLLSAQYSVDAAGLFRGLRELQAAAAVGASDPWGDEAASAHFVLLSQHLTARQEDSGRCGHFRRV